MSHDREEWRRPWRVEDPLPPGVAPADEPATPAPGGRPWPAAVTTPLPGQPTTDPRPADEADGRVGETTDTPLGEPTDHWVDAASGAPVDGTPDGGPEDDPIPMTFVEPAAELAAPPPRRGGRLLIVGALLGALVGGAAGAGLTLAVITPTQAEITQEPPPPQVSAPIIETSGEVGVVTAVAQAVTPSVVRIDVTDGTIGPGSGAIGSGVIYRSDGFILTNHHVIEPALDNDLQVTVRLASGDIIEAEVVGSDQLNDLAVVRVDRTDLPAINLRPDSEPLLVGETVVAIGSPFGLDASVTAGIISALNREIRVDDPAGAGTVIPSVIQTDAAINPGNSGGALVDAQGRLIGINTAILSRSGASQGVGFAVSAEQAITSADQLIEQGFVRHPLLGITGVDVTPEIAEQFGLPASRGAVIESVQPDTGAADADLLPGDIIVEIDGEPLATMSQLVAEVRARQPGDAMRLRVVRDGDAFDVDVVLGERPR